MSMPVDCARMPLSGEDDAAAIPAEADFDEEDYDVFLWWPSLTVDAEPSNTQPSFAYVIYGPVPPSLDHEEYCPEFGNVSSSPLSVHKTSEFRFPDPDKRVDEDKPESRRMPAYSKVVRMGLILSQVTHKIDLIFDKVRVSLQKTH